MPGHGLIQAATDWQNHWDNLIALGIGNASRVIKRFHYTMYRGHIIWCKLIIITIHQEDVSYLYDLQIQGKVFINHEILPK